MAEFWTVPFLCAPHSVGKLFGLLLAMYFGLPPRGTVN